MRIPPFRAVTASLLSVASVVSLTVAAQDGPITISARGKRGSDATHGHDGEDGVGGKGWGSKRGQSGKNGTNASTSTPGTDADHIQARLQTVKGTKVALTGNVSGSHSFSFNYSFDTRTMPYLDFIARGGDGGHGGFGGNGGKGGRGGDGADATQYTWGEDGGDGGDGGNGGNGSPGSAAGSGGNIMIEVDERDAQLLMLVGTVDTDGGNGGNPGRNGSGGQGGSGGSGGSGYSWTETVSDGTDSNGNPQSHIEYHSNPGGSNGSSGRNGSDGHADVSGGTDGLPGRFTYVIGGKNYASRYDVRVESFEIESENHDGIFEPGETVTVSKIRVRNVGGMPTPKYAPIKFFVRDHDWVVSLNKPLLLKDSLPPNATADLVGELQFRIAKEGISSRGKPFSANSWVSPRGNQTVVDRDFESSEKAAGFTIQYPLKISGIKVPRNLGPGQSAKVSWTVTNISTQEYGSLSKLKRVIESQLKLNLPATTTRTYTYRDSKGANVDLETGSLSRIERLAPGATVTIEGTIQLPTSAEPYQKIGLETGLGLGSRGDGKKATPIQSMETVINISYVYARSEGSDAVIVTNHDTTRQELAAWNTLLTRYGIRKDVWDLSYEGHLDFEKVRDNGTTLADDLKGKLLIVLNNAADGMRASEMISHRQLLAHAFENGIRVHFVGGDAAAYLAQMNDLLVPEDQLGTPAANGKEFSRILVEKLGMAKDPTPKTVRFVGSKLVRSDDWFKIDAFSTAKLEREAKALERDLRVWYPGKRLLVRTHYAPKVIEDGVLTNRIEHGTLSVFETLPGTESTVTALSVDDASLHGEAFVLGSANQRALTVALDLDRKLELARDAASGRLSFGDKLGVALAQARAAILSDIALEQKALRSKPKEWFGVEFKSMKLFEILNRVEASLASPESKAILASGTPEAGAYRAMILALATDVHNMARTVYHGNDWVADKIWAAGSTDRKVTAASVEWAKKLIRSILPKDEAKTRIAELTKASEKATHSMTQETRRSALDRLAQPVPGLVRDSLVRQLPEERVISEQALAQILGRRQTLESRRSSLETGFTEEKGGRN
jgi:hypothetical protein